MGCASSTESAAANNASKGPPTNENEKNNYEKREKKITACTETSTMAISNHDDSRIIEITATATATTAVTVGNLSIRYASSTQRGRDPDDASKPNQDCYSSDHEMSMMFGSNGGNNNNSNCNESSENTTTHKAAAFFGVYDGHGPHGEACSQFVRRRLPDLVKKNLVKERQNKKGNLCNASSLSIDQVQASLHKAHTDCNDELRATPNINDAYSGTTAVSLYIHGQDGHDESESSSSSSSRITVCNVGDSRAVLGTCTKLSNATTTSAVAPSSLQAVPLSNDQTPHRSDEAARCVRSGARILSFGEINQDDEDDDDSEEVEDPPRVWAQKGKYPGTAFTRSIGDAVAEKLGVFAEPEMVTVKLSANEKLIVLASDGVFDVMSNRQVIDLCFQHKDDPTQACSAVIEKSHQEWLLNEGCVNDDGTEEEEASYDDMTIICIFIDDVRDDDESSNVGSASVAASTNIDDDHVQLPPPSTTTQPQPQQDHPKRVRVRQKTLRNLEEMEEN